MQQDRVIFSNMLSVFRQLWIILQSQSLNVYQVFLPNDHLMMIRSNFNYFLACESHTFAPKSIQYVKTSQKRVKLMRSVLNLTDDIDITSMVVRLAEMPNYSITEIPQYSFEEWLSGEFWVSRHQIFCVFRYWRLCRTDSWAKYFADFVIFNWICYTSIKGMSKYSSSLITCLQLFGRIAVRIKRKYDAIKRNRLQGRNYVSPATKHRPTAIDRLNSGILGVFELSE